MKIKIIVISIILLLGMIFACGCIPFMENLGMVSPTNEEQLSPEKDGSPDGLIKVLIGFKEKPGPAEQALVKVVGGQIKYTYHIVDAIAASIPEKAIDALQKNPNVTHVELDGEIFAIGQTLPWGVDRIDAEVVHTYTVGNKGAGVNVAILDTGIDVNHPDLEVVGGKNFVFGRSYDDKNGHGTHVAGIVAALDNNIGVIGVAPEANLYAVKILNNSGIGWWSDLIAGLEWCVNNGMEVANMSLGAKSAPSDVEAACNSAYVAGVLLVAAAGNEYGGPVIYPAAYSNVIAISAIDSNDKLAYFSSIGEQVELAAPGVDIYSTYKGGGYTTMSGTSMASPHVAGTAALVIAAGISDVRSQLQSTADDLGSAGVDSEYGYGLVDAENAVLGTTSGNNLPPPAAGTIAGNVIDASTGLAIAGATVDVEGTSLFGTTETNGYYTIVDVAVGTYTVTASATGYIEQSKTAEVLKDQTTVVDFALTPAPMPSNVMHVSDIDMSWKTAGPNVNAIATVKIVNADGSLVEGATVSGHWSGATSDSDSGITDANGQVSFKSDKIKNPVSGTTFTFTVDDVTKDGWTYDSSANVETSDSITI